MKTVNFSKATEPEKKELFDVECVLKTNSSETIKIFI